MAGEKHTLAPIRETKDAPLKQFAVAGADKKWFWADARIEKDTVSVLNNISGMRPIVIPGARIVRMVTMKLMAPTVVEIVKNNSARA